MNFRNKLEELRAQMVLEEKAARIQIQAEWQQLFRDVYDLIPEYLREYCTFSVANELEQARIHPWDFSIGGFKKEVQILVPDFPAITLTVEWSEINKKWNLVQWTLHRVGSLELVSGHWQAVYRQSKTFSSNNLDALLKEGILEREYVNALLDAAEKRHPNGAPGPGCKEPRLYIQPDEFSAIKRKYQI